MILILILWVLLTHPQNQQENIKERELLCVGVGFSVEVWWRLLSAEFSKWICEKMVKRNKKKIKSPSHEFMLVWCYMVFTEIKVFKSLIDCNLFILLPLKSNEPMSMRHIRSQSGMRKRVYLEVHQEKPWKLLADSDPMVKMLFFCNPQSHILNSADEHR